MDSIEYRQRGDRHAEAGEKTVAPDASVVRLPPARGSSHSALDGAIDLFEWRRAAVYRAKVGDQGNIE
jgi:hypothetical protein